MSQLHFSAIDPLFYAHHCHIDYLLLQAQILWAEEKFPLNYSYGPDLKLESELFGCEGMTVKDVLDVSDLCIRYEQPKSQVKENNTNFNNFTLEVSKEWLNSSFGNSSEQRVKEAEETKEGFGKKVDEGSIIITTVNTNEKDRPYVGANKPGKKLKRLGNNASSAQLGVSGLIILLTMFL
jgi:hypothetical protein